MGHKILVINPGSTSTKVAIYEDCRQAAMKSIEHSATETDRFDEILDQEHYRVELIRDALDQWNIDVKTLSAVSARGGLLPNVKAGGYLVTETMVQVIRSGRISPHASNLGALLAFQIAEPLGIPAYVYDCVTSDEFTELAKMTGLPEVKRESICHVLNMKAVSRKVAAEWGTTYEKMRLIVAHLGGGITIGLHKGGKIIDAVRDDEGPFSPERSGGMPFLKAIDLCYCGRFTKQEMIKKVRGMGGMKAYLGTQDCRQIEDMIRDGDELAAMVYQAQAYQIAKGIGELAPVVNGELDCIILTGGLAYSKKMTDMIAERVRFIAPVKVVAGENEMDSLAMGAARILDGEPAREYIGT